MMNCFCVFLMNIMDFMNCFFFCVHVFFNMEYIVN